MSESARGDDEVLLPPRRRFWKTDHDETLRIRATLIPLVLTAQLMGAVTAVLMVAFVVPGPSIFQRRLGFATWVVAPTYIVLAIIVGVVVSLAMFTRDLRWFSENRAPSAADQRSAFRLPWRLAFIQAAIWAGGFVVVTTAYGLTVPALIPKVAGTVIIAAIVVCSIAYLLTEVVLRPIAASVIASGYHGRQRVSGVAGRSTLGWITGTGIPLVGVIMLSVLTLAQHNASVTRLAISTIVICAVLLVTGLVIQILTSAAIVAPIRVVQQAMTQIAQGDFETQVVVFDGTELGDLQSGFNNMAQGLRERERIREVFGQHVGQNVAERALADQQGLGGQEEMVAVFFIDLIGSTGLAVHTAPTKVVSLLNRFFEVIVSEVDERGGFVNKFVGDAALAIFGAPSELVDPAGQALAAARTIMSRLDDELPECEAAIGISYGRAVAGNVGARERYEYTVIGDPVNEAARLSEIAKTIPGRIVASAPAIEAAAPSESALWHFTQSVLLRGRTESTHMAIPLTK